MLSGGSFNPTNIVLNGGTLAATSNNVVLNSLRGILLGTNGGGLGADSGRILYVPNVVSGTVLTVTGPGTVVLGTITSANSYTGGTIVAGGTLNITNEPALGPAGLGDGNLGGSLTLTNGGILQTSASMTLNNRAVNLANGGGSFNTDNGTTLIITNVITGPGGLTKLGPGFLALNDVNTYTGGTLIAGGTLTVTNDNALGVPGNGTSIGSLFLTNGGMLEASGTWTNNNRAVYVLNGGGGFNVDANQTLTITNTVAGGGTLIKAGSGVLQLFATNTYSGGTIIKFGLLDITNDAALGAPGTGDGTTNGSLTISANGMLEASGTWTNANRAIYLVAVNAGGGFSVDPGQTLTITNALTGNGSGGDNFTLYGSNNSTLVLSGNNTYQGVTTVAGGLLDIKSAQALGDTNGFSGYTSVGGGALRLDGGLTTYETLKLAGPGIGDGFGALQSANGTNTWAGPITLNDNTVQIGTLTNATLIISGQIDSQVNAYGLNISTANGGTVILTASNIYLGNISPKLSEPQLTQLFGRFGPLASIKIMYRSADQKPDHVALRPLKTARQSLDSRSLIRVH